MNVSKRLWWIKFDDKTEGPLSEDEFQTRLRAGEFPLKSMVKNNVIDPWEPMLQVVSKDASFRRASTMPPPKDTKI